MLDQIVDGLKDIFSTSFFGILGIAIFFFGMLGLLYLLTLVSPYLK